MLVVVLDWSRSDRLWLLILDCLARAFVVFDLNFLVSLSVISIVGEVLYLFLLFLLVNFGLSLGLLLMLLALLFLLLLLPFGATVLDVVVPGSVFVAFFVVGVAAVATIAGVVVYFCLLSFF